MTGSFDGRYTCGYSNFLAIESGKLKIRVGNGFSDGASPYFEPGSAPLEGKVIDQALILPKRFDQKTSNTPQAMPDRGQRQP